MSLLVDYTILNRDICLILPSSVISHCYVVFPCFSIVSVWCQIKLHSKFIDFVFAARQSSKWLLLSRKRSAAQLLEPTD